MKAMLSYMFFSFVVIGFNELYPLWAATSKKYSKCIQVLDMRNLTLYAICRKIDLTRFTFKIKFYSKVESRLKKKQYL